MLNVESALNIKDKFYLVMKYNSVYTLLDSICYYLIDNFLHLCNGRYWFIVVFSCNDLFEGFRNGGLRVWVRRHCLWLYILARLREMVYLLLKCLVESQQWTHSALLSFLLWNLLNIDSIYLIYTCLFSLSISLVGVWADCVFQGICPLNVSKLWLQNYS